MESLFNRVKKMTRERHLLGAELDREIEKRWGFHYSETDDDPIIDTLDYGTNSITYDEFVKRMDEYKKNIEETGQNGVIP